MTRISTIQRRQRGIGKLRTGMTVPTSGGKTRPAASKTWIVTSPDERLVTAAAEVWGGKVELWTPFGGGAQQYRVITESARIDALLMPGNPLVQNNELWTKAGCQRVCDGEIEKMSGKPCLCAAEWGERFWTVAPEDQVCDPTSRLKVLIPDIPKTLGTWLLETKSYNAAAEMSGFVDDLLASVNPNAFVPVILGIEQRSKRHSGGRKDFSVPYIELPEATANKVMGALASSADAFGTDHTALTTGPERRAITAGPARPDYAALIKAAKSKKDLRMLWSQAMAAGHMDPVMKMLLEARSKDLPEDAPTETPPGAKPTGPAYAVARPGEEPQDAEIVPDEDEEEPYPEDEEY